ncbi:MAG: extracellular solute-binding protein [Chloroflexi bacterium]|nr:extracellular solute-binding protein [Chloroflexota bacterium]
MDTKFSRRAFLKVSAIAGTAVIVAACAPTAVPTAAPTAAPKATEAPKATTASKATEAPKATAIPKATEAPQVGFQGEIEFYAQSYTPTSENPNADPKAPKREALKLLSIEWVDLHPGISFKFMQAPSGDYISWIQTQLVGGTGPDIFWIWLGSLNNWADEGKTVPINDYLELPNKYTPEETTAWKNTFKDPFLDSYSVKGNFGGVPMDLVSTGMYTNVDMLKEVGIDFKAEIKPEIGSPDSWETMIGWCKKLKEAGYFAMSAGMGVINQWWTTGVFSDQFLNSWIEKYDLLNYYTIRPVKFQKGVVSQEEVCHAYFCKGLDVFAAPDVRDMFRVIAEWTQYMPTGWANPDYGNPMELFLTGELAMVWDGSWSVGTIMQDSRRQFEFSSFWLPPITRATSEYVPDPPYLPIGVGGYGSLSFGLNRKTIAKGNVEECVDWLMYITTPEHDEMVVNEVPSFIPSNKKAKSLPEVENLFVGETRLVAGGTHPVSGPYSWFGWQEDKWGDLLRREQTLYFMGEEDADTFFNNLKEAGVPLAKEVIRKAAVQYSEDGSWDLTQWECQPEV